MEFTIIARDKGSRARTGILQTGHGPVETPIFMPVGTLATVKAVPRDELESTLDIRIMLSNTYHLYLRPGTDIIREAGGLHRFMGWNRALLTDSGGYQVYSLGVNRKIREDGVAFQSHIDGSRHFFSPESAIDIQRIIGADIIMAFDECTPYPCDKEYASQSMHLTHRWLDRCFRQFHDTEPLYGHEQALFPIVQGSVYRDLREQSATYVASKATTGCAIGGLSVGEPHETMYEMTSLVCRILPDHLPRYLMGVGTPANILESIALGVDMFDCVMPTRHARNGQIFTQEGIINIRNRKWARDFSPLDPAGSAEVSTAYSKAYLRHLFISNEILGLQIATMQNLGLYMWLVREARKRIQQGNFHNWKNEIIRKLDQRL